MELHEPKRIPMRLDMAPLIDVVFLLLVFFMLTSSMQPRQALELSLPESGASNELDNKALRVAIDKNGALSLNGELTSLDTISAEIDSRLKGSSQKTVTLATDSTTSVQTMVSVMDQIKKGGATDVALETDKQSK